MDLSFLLQTTPIPVQVVPTPGKVSDIVLLGIIGGTQAIILAVIGYFQAVSLRQGTEAAEMVRKVADKAEHVRLTLVESTDSNNKQLKDIHTLVNSERGALLKVAATAMRALAVASSIDHAKNYNEQRHHLDLMAAEQAEKLLIEHEAKQGIVDERHDEEAKEIQS
jgi:hypothetical protein